MYETAVQYREHSTLANKKPSRRMGRSELLTSTPYKTAMANNKRAAYTNGKASRRSKRPT